MSGSDLAVAVVAVACFYSLWWCLSLARRLRRMERTAKLDPMTGLGSGDWLHNERWPAALRSGRPIGIAYIDLDHLKLTNDSLGHSVGDEYIRTAADTIGKAVRRGVDEVFRSSQAGDEFEVLLHGPIGDPNRAAWSLLQRLADRGVSASLGLAYTTVTEFVPARANLRLAAEAACRAAKKRGGGCGILAGHGLVTAPAIDLADRSRNPPSNASALPGAPAQPTTDGVPVEIHEGITTAPWTPAAQALLAAESSNGAGPPDENSDQQQADGDRIGRKHEAVGWTSRQRSLVGHESEATRADIERARRHVAPSNQPPLETCLNAELARQGLASEKR